MTVRAVITLSLLSFSLAAAAAAPTFFTGGPCPTDAASHVPAVTN